MCKRTSLFEVPRSKLLNQADDNGRTSPFNAIFDIDMASDGSAIYYVKAPILLETRVWISHRLGETVCESNICPECLIQRQ